MSLAGFKYFNGSFDTLGLIARSVDDVALLWQVQVTQPLEPIAPVAQAKVGLCRTPWWRFADPPSREALDRAGALLSAAGAQVSPIDLPQSFAELHELHKAIQAFEAAHSYAWEYDTHRAQLDESVLSLIETGQRISFHRYLEMLQVAKRARAEFERLMTGLDAILAPSAPGEPPPSRRVAGPGFVMGDPVMSRGWTLLHVPCITLPHFTGPNGMPVGVQLIGSFGADEQLLRVAKWVEARFRDARKEAQRS
jgi:Asp-tRNA(Asn)/Glu-tRNA(Gln) amidotransferase A subunit family amidase